MDRVCGYCNDEYCSYTCYLCDDYICCDCYKTCERNIKRHVNKFTTCGINDYFKLYCDKCFYDIINSCKKNKKDDSDDNSD